jgi:hypothetical protein
MGAPQVGVLRRHRVGRRHHPEERFHLPRRLERDQDPAALLPTDAQTWGTSRGASSAAPGRSIRWSLPIATLADCERSLAVAECGKWTAVSAIVMVNPARATNTTSAIMTTVLPSIYVL